MVDVVTCKNCGEEFEGEDWRDRKYCSKDCFHDSGDYVDNLPKEARETEKLSRSCRYCGEEFETTEFKDEVYCDQECHINDISNDREFEECQNPECGDTLSGKYQKKYCSTDCAYRHRELKAIVSIECDWCGSEFERKKCNVKENNFCSRNCYYRYKKEEDILDYEAENNPHWKGGYSPDFGSNWEEQRRKCWERDSYSCVVCGKGKSELGQRPAVHHIKPRRCFEKLENANRLDNLVTLCQHHHMVVEGWNLIPSNSDVDLKKLEA
ncbi:HNH endonuclease [Haloferax sp. Q22]|uniref:HNH endonuclease n=1 Tax=Haloferax sp. (strain Q22) TaxID=1526048 RepID=UPI000A498145|nr:HNH endonuclease [Haloferax sp. Q22]